MSGSERSPPQRPSRIAAETPWYDLFSRGARDWLRHNEKVREAVHQNLADLLSNMDVLSRPDNRTVLVPVRMLEHARFRLRDADEHKGTGQGQGKPGDVLRPAQQKEGQSGSGGRENGGLRFVLELKIEDIVDWIWEELKLPDLKPKTSATVDDPEYTREGWDKRGPHARLDRRRTMKEAVKRRAVQEDPVPFTNEDLRYRALTRRSKPASNAVVVFLLDVSGSMEDAHRKLAKTFFFFALQGIRREYAKVETVFIAHAVEAWEFNEQQFFEVAGSGGTVTSVGFKLADEILKTRYDPARYNAYLFYASDGENASGDEADALATGVELAAKLNYGGYLQVGSPTTQPASTQIGALFAQLRERGLPVASAALTRREDVWEAIRLFFREQAEQS